MAGPIVSGYGMRISDFSGEPKLHEGMDIAAPIGTALVASATGVVISSRDAADGYGLTIVLDHGRRLTTSYSHLSRSLVYVGQFVKAGDIIALSGESGLVTGPHLHFEIRIRSYPRNPSRYRMVTPYENPTRFNLSPEFGWVCASQRLIAFK